MNYIKTGKPLNRNLFVIMTNSRSYSECAACIIRPISSLSLGIFAITQPLCTHADPNLTEPKVVLDPKRIKISLLYTIALIACLGLFLFRMLTEISPEVDNFSLAFKIASCNIIYFTINFYFLTGKYSKYTESLCLLVFRRRNFAIESPLLPKSETDKIFYIHKFYFAIAIIHAMLKTIAALIKEPSVLLFLEELGPVLTMFSAYYLAGQIQLLLTLYHIIFQSFHAYVISILMDRKLTNTDLKENIPLLRLFYIYMCRNYKENVFCFGNLSYYIVLFLTNISVWVLAFGSISDLLEDLKHIHISPILRAADTVLSAVWFCYSFVLFCEYADKNSDAVSVFFYNCCLKTHAKQKQEIYCMQKLRYDFLFII